MTLNDDGNVSFSDFMATTAKREQYSNKTNLEDIFGMFKNTDLQLTSLMNVQQLWLVFSQALNFSMKIERKLEV